MSTLANHAFIKMNGLGNEIVVVDMRGQAGAITAAEARAAAQPDGAPYDQLMTLHTARTPGTDGYVRIYNNDGSEAGACGNGMRCIAELLFEETGKRALTFETKAGLLACWKDAEPQVSTVDMGAPRFAWHEIPLAEATDDTRALDLQIGPVDQDVIDRWVPKLLAAKPGTAAGKETAAPADTFAEGRSAGHVRASPEFPTAAGTVRPK